MNYIAELKNQYEYTDKSNAVKYRNYLSLLTI